MGKSFVMKRPDGSLAGYLMQESDGTVCFRAHALPEEGARLTLVFEGGAQVSRAVSGERETTWAERSGAVEAAFVCRDERLLMSTGERGRGAFERMREKTRARAAVRRAGEAQHTAPVEETANAREKAPEQAPDREQDKAAEPAEAVETLETGAPRAASSGHALPERRWPPPPCMPGARYEEGRWQA